MSYLAFVAWMYRDYQGLSWLQYDTSYCRNAPAAGHR